MSSNGDSESVTNSIVAEALKAAGVPDREINLPAETNQDKALPNRTRLDGSLKGQVKGELAEEPDDTEVQNEEVDGASSKESAKPTTVSKEEIAMLLDQANRNFQSIMDRKLNQINTQMNQTINALNQFFQTQDTTSLNNLPAEEQVLKRLERLEKGGQMPKVQIQQPIEQQPANYIQFLVNMLDTVGLSVDDKRIDWAPDVSDPQIGYNRFTGSLKRALLEDQTKVIQDLKSSGDREISKVRKKTGVDRVSTVGASGAGSPDVNKMTPFEKLTYAFQQEETAKKT